ncbi:MAG: hypothetical protein PHC34_02640, partial [Candidatus Gastranaerophilales bacterium]|nr:hypothetical protein [Candidatus Gastranaerophilales bacterium]
GINDYKFVAFSQGKILHSINSDHWQICKKNPTERQLDCYREYLKISGMDPETIINKARDGKKTVIIDFCDSGKGMNAFLEILRDWSLELNNYEDLKKSVTVVPMFYYDNFSKIKENYLINNEIKSVNLFKEFDASPINLLELDRKKYLTSVFEHKSYTIFERSYPVCMWDGVIPARGPKFHKRNSELAKFAIIDYLARKNILKD